MRRNSIIATVVIAALLIISVIGVNQWTAEATCIDCTCPGGDVITGGLGAGGSCTVEGNDDPRWSPQKRPCVVT